MTQPATEVQASIVDGREDHIPFLAWVVLTAFRSHLERGMWEFFVDGSEADRLRFLETLAATETRHWEHYSNFIVAEHEGKPVAALCGYFEAECAGLFFQQGVQEACKTLGWTEAEVNAGWGRAGTIVHCSSEHAPGAWIVENVATLPEFRRRGLVDRLLQEILERGRTADAPVAEIGVFIGNDGAQRAYEKAGFAVIDEKRHPDFEAVYGCPGARLLRRQL